jgi:acetyl esterase/lipase
MKFTSFVCLACIAFLLLSCQFENPNQHTVVSGRVKVNWSETINLRQGSISLAESWANQTDHRDSIIPLNANGTFQVHLSLEEPTLYSLAYENYRVDLILSPGDSIHVNFTSDTLFSGSHAKLQKHMDVMVDEITKIQRFVSKNEKKFFAADLSTYHNIVDSLESAYLNKHEEFAKNNTIPKVFDEKIRNEINYRSKFYQIVYPAVHEMYSGEVLDIDDSYFDTIVQGSFNDPKLLELRNYTLFLERYVDIMSAGDLRFRNFYDAGIQKIHPKYTAIKNLSTHQEIKDYLLYEHIRKSISNYGVAYLDTIILEYEQIAENPLLKQKILDLHKKGINRRTQPDSIKMYKTIGNIELEAHIFYPENHSKRDKAPVYAFFHGGGWAVGIPEWGYQNCQWYQEKGMVAISFEYRLIDIHGSNIIDCVKDVNSAILWIRNNANELGIDPNKIVAAGFSAGGHLASATAILDEFTLYENGFNSKPNAFIAHSASYDLTKGNFFKRQSDGNPESISNHHHVKKGLPPALFFHGTNDHLAPISEFTAFRDQMELYNNEFEYKIFQNVGHFFNNEKASEEVRELTDQFLQKQGYIN